MTLIPIQSQTGLVSGSVMVAISCLLALGLLHCGDSGFIRVSGFREDLALIDRCWLLWLHPLLVQSFVTFCQIGTCIMNAFMGTLTRKFNNDSPWTTIIYRPIWWQLSISSICIGGSSFMPPHRARTVRNWSSSGPRLNIKTVLSAYGVFHVKDKTAVRKSYL